AVSIFKDMPLPNRPDGSLIQSKPLPSDSNIFLIRADYNLRRNTIDARYFTNRSVDDSFEGAVPSYGPLRRRLNSWNLNVADTVILSPGMVFQTRATYGRMIPVTTTLNHTTMGDYGSNYPKLAPADFLYAPEMAISGRIDMVGARPAFGVDQSFVFMNSLSWTKNRHAIKFGFDLVKLKFLWRNYDGNNGSFTFSGDIT